MVNIFSTVSDEWIKLPDENYFIDIINKGKDIRWKYALKYGNTLIGVSIYQLRNTIPEDMKVILPKLDGIVKQLKIFE